MELKVKYFFSKKEIKEIICEMSEIFGEEIVKKMLNKKDRVEVVEFDKIIEIFFVNGKFFFIRRKEFVFFFVIVFYEFFNEEDLRKWLRRVVVDEGVVLYILNGVDVMVVGIVDVDENINEGDFVFVVEENYGRFLVIGIVFMDGRKMKEKLKGKVVKNIYYVKDKIW